MREYLAFARPYACDLSKTSCETSDLRTLGGERFCRTRYWRSERKLSRTYWPIEKPTMTVFQGKRGLSRKRARRCEHCQSVNLMHV